MVTATNDSSLKRARLHKKLCKVLGLKATAPGGQVLAAVAALGKVAAAGAARKRTISDDLADALGLPSAGPTPHATASHTPGPVVAAGMNGSQPVALSAPLEALRRQG